MPKARTKTTRVRARHKLEHVSCARGGVARKAVERQPALARHQMAELRKLARDRGTSVATELGNAVDAYVLGISPADVGKLDEALERLGASTGRKRPKTGKR